MIQVGLLAFVRGEVNDEQDGKGSAPSIPAKASALVLASSDMVASISATSKLEILSLGLADFRLCVISSSLAVASLIEAAFS